MTTAIGTTPKQFKCPKCSYASNRKGDLDEHLKLHYEEKILCDGKGCGHESSCRYDATEHQKNHNPYIYFSFFFNIFIYLYLKFNEKCECGARFLNKKNLTRHQNESCISRPTESTGLGGHISTLVSGLPVASTQGCFFVD
jgi:hypothetical protein